MPCRVGNYMLNNSDIGTDMYLANPQLGDLHELIPAQNLFVSNVAVIVLDQFVTSSRPDTAGRLGVKRVGLA
jgi:hypothetical protein